MLTKEIINNWAGMPSGFAHGIPALCAAGYESWTVKTSEEYGVAIPVSNGEEISEYFAGAHYYTRKIVLNGVEERNALLLTTGKEEIEEQFASLCAELLNPGENGEFRKEIMDDPTVWWLQWKELLGNKSVDQRTYDTLGELWTLKYLAEHNENAEWNGPNGATYDIECDGFFAEVKSSTARNKREITLNNLFQLEPPNGMKLYLVLCQFEAAQSGISINSLVSDLEKLGYSGTSLNEKLEKLGLEKGKTARKRNYILHAATKYEVNSDFPAIRESSFLGGTLPAGVKSITYTVSLEGVNGKRINEE